jgi:hypothetical protein
MFSFTLNHAVFWLALGTFLVASSPIEKRATIPHDEVVGFPQTVPSGIEGTLYLKYQPFLDVINGCVPFPAVDADGNVRSVTL